MSKEYEGGPEQREGAGDRPSGQGPGSPEQGGGGSEDGPASSSENVRVMATGVFDILHTGHLFFLREARRLGSELVVVVARDITARKRKREPVVPEHLRLEMVKGLKPVDRAVLGDKKDYYKIVEILEPDIIALGYDQDHNEDRIRDQLAERDLDVEVVRLPVLKHDLLATRRIVNRIAKLYPEGGLEDTEREWARSEGVEDTENEEAGKDD